jgi:large repetitive protein
LANLRLLGLKILGLTLALALLIFPASIPVTGASVTVSVFPASKSYSPGADFWVDLKVTSVTNLNQYSVTVTFNKNVLRVVGSEGGAGIAPGVITSTSPVATFNIPVTWSYTSADQTAVVINGDLGATNLKGANGTGTLASLHLEVVGQAGTSSPLTLSGITLTNALGGVITAGTPTDGLITVPFPPITVSLSTQNGLGIGDEMIVPINTTLVPQLKAYQISVDYDPAVLQIIGAEGGSEGVTSGLIGSTVIPIQYPSSYWGFYPSGTQGTIRITVLINNSTLTGSGQLANLHFMVVGGAGETSQISFTNDSFNKLFDWDEKIINDVTWTAASFSVSNYYRISTTALPAGEVGINYSKTLTATSGVEPYTFSVVNGAFPNGLSMTARGLISGKPTTAVGPLNMTFQVKDANGEIATKTLPLTIYTPVQISSSTLASGYTDVAYSTNLTATGGSGSYTWSVYSGNLPAWATLTNNTISGVPTTAGTFSFYLKVYDGIGSDTDPISFTILQSLTFSTTSLPNGDAKSAYSQALIAIGGTGAYTWSIISGALPTGLSLKASSGVISGTPTLTGTSNFTAKVTDGVKILTRALSIKINPALVITTTTLAVSYVGSVYSQSLAATGGSGSYTWSCANLPDWASISGSTLSGTPAQTGATNLVLVVNDGLATVSVTLTLTVSAGINITTASLAQGDVGTAYSQTLAASGGKGTYTWSIAGGALPPGLTLKSTTGVISGTPTSAASTTVTFSVRDSVSNSGTRALPITINPVLTIATGFLPSADAGTFYSQDLDASGGTGVYTWSISAGILPTWAHLSGSTISGNPGATGTSTFTVKVNDGISFVTKSLSIKVYTALTLTTNTLASGDAGSAYSQTLSASGGNGTFNWSISAGSLPAWAVLSGNVIRGTPTAAGSTTFTVQLSDGTATLTRVYTIVINPALTISTTSLADGDVGIAYSQTLTAGGGSGSYTWSLNSGTLPTWAKLSGGVISGNPNAAASTSFSLKLGDGITNLISTYTIKINPALTFSTTALADGNMDVPYAQTLTATGGSGSYSWAISAGSLPAWASLNGNSLSGTPNTSGTTTFTVQLGDGITSLTRVLSIKINGRLGVVTTNLADGDANVAYSQTLIAGGGSGSYTWSLKSGTLPAGLSLKNTTGVISGTPTTAATSNFMVQVNDGVTTASGPVTIKINAVLTVSTTNLNNADVKTAYSQTLSASGGSGSYSWSISLGSLPAGMTLSGGTISGTPTTAATSSFTVKVSDNIGSATRGLSIKVNPALLISTTQLANGNSGTAYTQTLAATGGSGSYSWSISSGSLPAWASLSGNTISGTPNTAGTTNFSVQVNDGIGWTIQPLSITINPLLTITTTQLPDGNMNTLYSQALKATGGSGSYTWSISSGSLPAWAKLANGTIAGTPTAAASTTFGVTVRDGISFVNQTLVIKINPALLISTPALPNGDVGVSYAQTLAATGGSGSYTWSISGLPSWAHQDGNLISGTPDMAATSTLTVRVGDGIGSATKVLTVKINLALNISTTSLVNGNVGTAYTQTLSATGGSGSYTWTISAGSLPSWATLAAGKISGNPVASGTTSFSVQVADGIGVDIQNLSITINPALTIVTTALGEADKGALYTQNLMAGGGSGSYTWTLNTGSLPTWAKLNNGIISGTPGVTGSTTFTLKVTDGITNLTKSYTLKVNAALVISTTTLTIGYVNSPYTRPLAATGGSGSYVWSVSSGTLPAWARLSGNTISGTPNAVGSTTFTVQVDDGIATDPQVLTITIGAGLDITTTVLPSGNVNTAYSQTLAVTGGSGVYTWSVSGTPSLPGGLKLTAASGLVSGTPTVSFGPATLNFTVTDSASNTITEAVSLTIYGPMAISTTNLPDGDVATYYSQTLMASGGRGSYSWSISAGVLPSWAHLDGNVISGTPDAVATTSFTVKASDGTTTLTRVLSIKVNAALVITTSSLAVGYVNLAYNQPLAGGGGSGVYSWTISVGNLPSWATLINGVISGTPDAAATTLLTAQLSDGIATRTVNLSIVIKAALTITTTALADADLGTLYSQTLTATGGSGSYSWSINSGSLPVWASLVNGQISGTPSATGTTSFSVRVNDGVTTQTRNLSINVNPALVISTVTLAKGYVGKNYQQTLTASGGSGSYTWTISAGSLPAWAALSNGAISGLAANAGATSFTLQLTDGIATATQLLTITVNNALTVATTSLPIGHVGTAYSQTLLASGGSGTYTWSIEGAPVLPDGLTLTNSSGAITGTPGATWGPSAITFKVADNDGNTATRVITFTVYGALSIVTTALPEGDNGTAYSQTLTAGGGSGVYTWSISAGSLPTWATLSGNTISGTPRSAGATNFTVKVNDGNTTATANLTITINPTLVISTASLAAGNMSTPYSQTLTASGGNGNYSWTISAGALPGWAGLASNVISGTPGALGTTDFTVQVSDGIATVTRNLTIKINAALAISTMTLANAYVGFAYSQTLTATGGSGKYTWTLSSGALPVWASLSGNTISGTPKAESVANLVLQLTDGITTLNQVYSINTITKQELVIVNTSLPALLEDKAYSQTIVVTGGVSPYTWIITGLPTGLTASIQANQAVISGQAATPGTYIVTIRVTDSFVPATTVSKVMTLKVYMRYDVNGDEDVDMGDVVKIQRIYLGWDAETPAADANGDGLVNTMDITKLERVILQIDN